MKAKEKTWMVTVRVDEELHRRLLDVAQMEQRSMNTLCVRVLGEYCDRYYRPTPDGQTAEQGESRNGQLPGDRLRRLHGMRR